MKRRANSGVTQLELLVSLAIMGLIAILLANALDFSRQSLDRVRFLSEETDMFLARHALRESVDAIPLKYAGEKAHDVFKGTAQRFRFKSGGTGGQFREGAMVTFTVSVVTKGKGPSLILHGTGPHPSHEAQHDLSRILAQGISRFQIRYYGRRSSDTMPKWHDTWSDRTYLPDLVKLEWETGDARPAPPITLRPGKTARQSTMSLSSLVPPG